MINKLDQERGGILVGRIIRGVGNFFDVYIEDGRFKDKIVRCNSKGIFRYARDSIKPLVGDRVELELINKDVSDVVITDDNKDEALALIKSINTRRNYLVRPAVSNLDILFIVASVKSPAPAYYFIDKLTACAFYNDIEPVIIANKIDLLDAGEACELYNIYKRTEFKTIKLSAVSDNAESEAGFAELRAELRGRTCAFAGVSGAGKSSILNRLFNNLDLKTGALSEKIERGRHTTRTVELFRHDLDGFAADTPGFSMLDFDYVNMQDRDIKESSREILKEELMRVFPDLHEYGDEGRCKYRGCTHIKEDGCEVLAAVAAGKLAKSRHESYAQLYEQFRSKKT